MNLDEIKAKIGVGEYLSICDRARKAAPYTGNSQVESDFSSDVPHDLSWDIWESNISTLNKIELVFQLYEDMPCYTYLMYTVDNYRHFGEQIRDYFWSKYKSYLSGDDEALAKPVEYSLWCDYFENSDTVNEAWDRLVTGWNSEKLIQRVLICSGPVPYSKKATLYKTLLKNSSWHYYIFRSLLHSQFDVCGSIKKIEAFQVLKSLRISKDTPNLEELIVELEKK